LSHVVVRNSDSWRRLKDCDFMRDAKDSDCAGPFMRGRDRGEWRVRIREFHDGVAPIAGNFIQFFVCEFTQEKRREGKFELRLDKSLHSACIASAMIISLNTTESKSKK